MINAIIDLTNKKGRDIMKKVLMLLLVGVLVLSLAACTKKEEEKKSGNNGGTTVQDLIELSKKVHANVENIPFVEEMEIDIHEPNELKMVTGLSSSEYVLHAIRTEAMIGAQAYSFVLVRVVEDADIEAMKKEMLDNIDLGKWICAWADKVHVTNFGNIIMLVMGDKEISYIDEVYAEFEKASNNSLGKKLTRLAG